MIICKALYNQVCVDINGFYKPCCSFKGKSNISVNDMNPDEFLNSDYILNIRTKMENNSWDIGCSHCEKNYKMGLHSVKDSYDFYCKSPLNTFEMLEFAVSNKCNNQCRMCDSKHSTLWQKTLGLGNKPKIHYNLEKVLSSIKSNDIRVIKYLGGEPLITDEIFQIFNFIEKNKENKVSFYFNTNLTVPPEKYIDQLSNIENFIIGYSIDGVNLTNEYIRDGSKWNTIKKNLDKWEKYLTSRNDSSVRYVHTVLQAYNYHDIQNIHNFSKLYGLEHYSIPIVQPEEFTLDALPPDYINEYTTDSTVDFLKNYKYNHDLNKQLIEKTKMHDILLNKNISNYIPELSKILIR